MTTMRAEDARTRQTSSRAARWTVPLIAAAAVAARVAGVAAAPRSDEAGFLLVGRQWHAGGSSLYGSYWVDRPPLLISIFRLAAQLGGIVPLRLIGCLATALVVIGVGHVARRLAGDRAAVWAAVTAAGLSVGPVFGGTEVNGELLAAPFVVAGIGATAHAVSSAHARPAFWFAFLAGAAMVSALMVKQNMADVAVFAVTAVIVALWRREIDGLRCGLLAVGLAAGATVLLAVMAAWTVAHGTSLSGVYYAMYPFRLAAGHVIASSTGSKASSRLSILLGRWVVSGVAFITVLVVVGLAGRRLGGAAVWGLAATLAFGSFSVLLGGNYWQHYLVELVVPASILAGVMVARWQPGSRPVVVGVAAVAVISWAVMLPHAASAGGGTAVGSAIRAVSAPSDTIVTAYGHAEVTQASGLPSPYPYLWSLPAKTLDADQRGLDAILAGPSAPTWFVVWHSIESWGLRTGRTAELLAENYRPVADLHGHEVYLHDGVDRAAPHTAASPLRGLLP